eukprot:CAMPEP_0173072334 /NCGR_PEP_ID=MMETSP1102-20130122/9755_1 /TAXON_ID=49646 /ORGANISM="Geminigera sp., Strain Caron Lab Isolate" /LENGTH=234 /DNA_ID=CAMNT_0013940983 /DNA_START=929 /DNA_END=1634 /DNA_ORIENTATION=+
MTANARRQLRLGCRVKALLLAFFADVLAFLVHAESRAATVFAKCLAAPMLAKAPPATAFLALAFKAVMEAALAAVACRTTRPALAPAAGMGAESIVVHLAVVTGLGAAFVGAQAYAAALDAFVFALLVLAQPPAATLFALILDAVMMKRFLLELYLAHFDCAASPSSPAAPASLAATPASSSSVPSTLATPLKLLPTPGREEGAEIKWILRFLMGSGLGGGGWRSACRSASSLC